MGGALTGRALRGRGAGAQLAGNYVYDTGLITAMNIAHGMPIDEAVTNAAGMAAGFVGARTAGKIGGSKNIPDMFRPEQHFELKDLRGRALIDSGLVSPESLKAGMDAAEAYFNKNPQEILIPEVSSAKDAPQPPEIRKPTERAEVVGEAFSKNSEPREVPLIGEPGVVEGGSSVPKDMVMQDRAYGRPVDEAPARIMGDRRTLDRQSPVKVPEPAEAGLVGEMFGSSGGRPAEGQRKYTDPYEEFGYPQRSGVTPIRRGGETLSMLGAGELGNILKGQREGQRRSGSFAEIGRANKEDAPGSVTDGLFGRYDRGESGHVDFLMDLASTSLQKG